MTTDAWEKLEALADQRLPRGGRNLVAIVGSGLNAQAHMPDSWTALLERIASRIGASGATQGLRGSGMTAVWERLLVQLVHAQRGTKRRAAYLVERELQAEVARALGESHEQHATERPFLRRFMAFGFRDVLSLNFDRSLLVSNGGSGRVRGRSSLDRHGGNDCRVWYPHGDTARSSTIRLGVRSYGVYVGELAQAFDRYKARQRVFLKKQPSYRAWQHHIRSEPACWIDAALDAPLLFLGCGLSTDEWPLWWFLHQRARNHANRPARFRPPTFVMVQDGAPPAWLAGSPAGLELLGCETHAQGWKQLAAALG